MAARFRLLKNSIPLLLSQLVLSSSQAAFAWNDFGHMAVACIAYKNLRPQTKQRVDQLLKLNPYYERWKTELSESGQLKDLNTQIFMLAATWPDLIKKDQSYVSDGSSDGNRPVGSIARQNIGYKDKYMHKYWHFYDMPFSEDRTKAPKIPSPNAVTQINLFRKVLSSKKSDEIKSYDLTWLLHLVGDMHQPLHCATRVSKAEPEGDNGGNNVFVSYRDNPKARLHWFWDSCLGSGFSGDAMNFAETLEAQSPGQAADLNTRNWLKESFELSRSSVYREPVKAGNGLFHLSKEYQQETRELCKRRVALAGQRLAGILNRELK